MLYEIIIILSVAAIFFILIRKWPKIREERADREVKEEVDGEKFWQNEEEEKVDEPKLYLERAEKLFKDGRYKEAEKFYLKVAASAPEDAKLYGRLGVIYFKRSEEQGSAERSKAGSYFKAGNLKDAQEAFTNAVRLDPDNGFYQNNLGSVLYALGKYKQAVLYFENSVDIGEGIAKRWASLGLCYQKLDNQTKAAEAYDKAVKLEPGNKEYQELLKGVESRSER